MKNIFALFFLLILTSCGDDCLPELDMYLLENNLTTTELDKCVHIIIDEPGNNLKPIPSSPINVSYVGKLTDGFVFDSGNDKNFILSGLIDGWQIGLREIGEGGSCTLIIPPNVGYGSVRNGDIPGNSVLIFDITLHKIN